MCECEELRLSDFCMCDADSSSRDVIHQHRFILMAVAVAHRLESYASDANSSVRISVAN